MQIFQGIFKNMCEKFPEYGVLDLIQCVKRIIASIIDCIVKIKSADDLL